MHEGVRIIGIDMAGVAVVNTSGEGRAVCGVMHRARGEGYYAGMHRMGEPGCAEAMQCEARRQRS